MTGSSLARWRPIAGKHYNGRQGFKVSHIDLHIMCGTLAGSDSWFRQAGVKACSHYGVGGDGTVYQWIDEDNGSWADANRAADCSGITVEHQGGLRNVACTEACVESSARLCADIASRYGWGRLWHDGRDGNIWLHREIPGTTHADCPDLAPNGLPYQKVIDRANELLKGHTMSEWDEDLNGVKARDRLIGTDAAANRASNAFNIGDGGASEVGNCVWTHPIGSGDPSTNQAAWIRLYWTHQWTDMARNADMVGKVNKIAEQVADIEARIAKLEAGGVDASQVASQTAQAVSDALKGLTIKIGS